MRIIYTCHAEEQLIERKSIKVWVEETINFPDLIRRYGDKYIVTKKLNGKTLKVIYIKQKYIRVLTLYFRK